MNKKEKDNLRAKDRQWFKTHLPFEMWYGKEIHHDWKSEEKWCYLLSKEQHTEIEQKIYEREIGRV